MKCCRAIENLLLNNRGTPIFLLNDLPVAISVSSACRWLQVIWDHIFHQLHILIITHVWVISSIFDTSSRAKWVVNVWFFYRTWTNCIKSVNICWSKQQRESGYCYNRCRLFHAIYRVKYKYRLLFHMNDKLNLNIWK